MRLCGVSTNPPMPSEIWLSSESELSGRAAVIADEGESVWLYLTQADGRGILADCWLFNRVPAPSAEEIKAESAAYRERGAPPPAARDVTDNRAQLLGELDPNRVRIAWSKDGEAAAAWVDGLLAGFAISNERRGY